jgi:hypothetical protein
LDNIKTDIQEVGCGGVDWIDLGFGQGEEGDHVNKVMHLPIP